MTIRLINALSSPYGRKVAIALMEKRIDHDVQFDVPWNETTCVPQYSPLEQLPILVLEDGNTVFDSSFILEWLEFRYPDPPLLPVDPAAVLQVRFLKMLGERVMESIHGITFELQRADPSTPYVERHSRKVRRGLAEIERQIGVRRPSIAESITVGDITVAAMLLLVPFLIEHRFVPDLEELRWRERHPRLAVFADALAERHSFQATKPALMNVDLKSVVA